MNLRDRIKLAFYPENSDGFSAALAKHANKFFAGEDVSFGGATISEDAALKFSALFACFRVLAETYASVPIFEYKKLPNGDREQTDDTGLYEILHGITNEEMSAYNFKEASMYQICGGGNAIAIRQYGKMGSLLALMPIEWQRVQIEREKESGRLIYKVDNKKIYYRPDVLHIPGPSTNGIIGMSIIEYATQAIRLGLTYEKFAIDFYKKGATPSISLEHPTHFSPEAYKRFKDDFKKNHQGMANTGEPLILEDGMKANQLTMKLSDAELLASKKYQVEDICRFCRVPLHLVQNLDKATNNNIEHQSLEFAMYTMLPHFKRAEECINTQLLAPVQRKDGYYYEFNMNTLLRGDAQSTAVAFQTGRNGGWLSVNDIHRMLNMPRIKNGDIYLQPMNYMEAGKEPEEKINNTEPKITDEIEDLIKKAGIK